eukprot:TRINITY_DN3077_c0_g2_i1.p2 TRINITY_DN3077_c0_g2~~TRINITY_DN3077_c0_g2_i1.p2  ORF type:complete len:105 (-),score=17.96 TRINITY_DN3077_c0_g2_i1:419-733(-)
MEAETRPYYTLGLGKLRINIKRRRRGLELDKELYVRREMEGLNESLRLANKSSQAVYEKTTFCRPSCSDTIKQLLRRSRASKTCTKSSSLLIVEGLSIYRRPST